MLAQNLTPLQKAVVVKKHTKRQTHINGGNDSTQADAEF